MKKFLSVLLCISVFLSIFCLRVAGLYSFILGDVNDDGFINAKDSNILKKSLSGQVVSINEDAADINCDEAVNSKDSLLLKRHIAVAINIHELYDSEFRVKKLKIAGNDISEYTIVVPEDATDCMMFAAEELQHYISLSTGKELAVSTVESEKSIFISTDSQGEYALGDDGFAIKVVSGDLYIIGTAGETSRGQLYGVYELLEKYIGWRFLTEDLEYLHMAKRINIAEGTLDIQVPKFSFRHPYTGAAGLFRNATVEQIGAKLKVNGTHGRLSILKSKYGYGVGLRNSVHTFSESYSLFKDTQPCFSSEENLEDIISLTEDYIDKRIAAGEEIGKEITEVSIAQNDNHDFCLCRECRPVNKEEGSHAGALLRFVNRAADVLCEKYPGLKIWTLAYMETIVPPKITKPNDNVIVCIAPIEACFNHPMDGKDCSEGGNSLGWQNITNSAYIEEWSRITEHFYVWTYRSNYSFSLCPSAVFNTILPDVRFTADLGCDGMFMQTDCTGLGFDDLIAYLEAKVLWNPYMTQEQYLAYMYEFMELYYGDGWEYILEYINLYEHSSDLQGCYCLVYDNPRTMINFEYYAENYEYFRTLFERAYEKADNIQKERIKTLSYHVDFLGLSATYDISYTNGTAESRSIYAERYERLYNDLKAYYRDHAGHGEMWNNCLPSETLDLSKSPMHSWTGRP